VWERKRLIGSAFSCQSSLDACWACRVVGWSVMLDAGDL